MVQVAVTNSVSKFIKLSSAQIPSVPSNLNDICDKYIIPTETNYWYSLKFYIVLPFKVPSSWFYLSIYTPCIQPWVLMFKPTFWRWPMNHTFWLRGLADILVLPPKKISLMFETKQLFKSHKSLHIMAFKFGKGTNK